MLTCNAIGSLDSPVKMAAQFEVNSIVSHEPTLEEIFLTYDNKGQRHVK